MKAVISSTYDDKYLFFVPIVTWCWNKLGVDTILFIPEISSYKQEAQIFELVDSYVERHCSNFNGYYTFNCPEHKKATYSQCSRLYASALHRIQDDDVLVTSDIDMLVFNLPITHRVGDKISILGYDLVPDKQLPMCYASGTAKGWRDSMKIGSKSYQECLDELLGGIEAEHFRGNYWAKDQETLFNNLDETKQWDLIPRARQGTQFASNRIDRDDAYFMERLSPDIIDYHCHRPGYTEENFEKILSVIKYFYPNDDLTWMREYRSEYAKLIQ